MNYPRESDIPQQEITNSIKIFKFLVELQNDGVSMPVWRTLEIPEAYSFFDLHVAIQDSMNWSDVELHKFEMRNPKTREMDYIGIPDDFMCEPIVVEKNALIAKYFSLSNYQCTYVYSFIMPWTFRLTLEKILPAIPYIRYPRCIDGNGMAPEAAVGCIDGLGMSPEATDEDNLSSDVLEFDLKNIKFRDPDVAWLDAFQGF